jgi:deoxyribodipyrimidine photo-lyase
MLNIFWFRRDLRLDDNAGLFHALSSGLPVLPVFIFDEIILKGLENIADQRVTFIYEEISRLKRQLERSGSSLLVRYGKPEIIFSGLISEFETKIVFANHDYEPYARERDERITQLLSNSGIQFMTFKDQVIFEKNEVIKDTGGPYTVFTPYSRKWISLFNQAEIPAYNSLELIHNFVQTVPTGLPELTDFGFNHSASDFPSRKIEPDIIRDYHLNRDYPAVNGTSRLGIHLRFGTISIRRVVKLASGISRVFLNELIWREFYMMILWHFPRVVEQSFKVQYDRINWLNDEDHFRAWCDGMTGYPAVDAGMRELNASGYMHNRMRMITASFLTKHLLIDWRWGEAYFAKKLLDFELSSNNGGWQWAAGTGCDAAPYFRVFNPGIQAKKFDPHSEYIRKFVPELNTGEYPPPMIDHAFARKRAINEYKRGLYKNN